MIDVLFTYQHKAREIESLCLLKHELEKRGYTTAFICTFDLNRLGKYYKKARVVITSSLYDEASLWFFVYDITGFSNKVINLQWEQVLSNFDEANPNCFHNPKGFAKYALHLCWGNASRNRIIKGGVPENNAIVTGAIHLDFLRPEMKSYFLGKEELAKEFNININHTWCLFISSFTMHNMTDEEFNDLVRSYGKEAIEMKQVTVKSKRIILQWLTNMILEMPNMEFIYRPHPDETKDEDLLEMERIYSNFHVIYAYSAKQWILQCEKVMLWYSTTAAEIAFAGKGFAILRPFAIPEEYDISIYRGAKYIQDIESLREFIQNKIVQLPLDINTLNSYYFKDLNVPTYVKIADLIEDTLHTSKYDMQMHPHKVMVSAQLLLKRIKYSAKDILAKIFKQYAAKMPIIGKTMAYHISMKDRMIRDFSKNFADENEISGIMKNLNQIIS